MRPREPEADSPPENAVGASGPCGFDHTEIARLLPHRYPFQLVDRVLECVDGERIIAIKNVSLADPFLRGHFPERPLMPGVLICEALAQAGALLAYASTNGLRPGTPLVLSGLDGFRFRAPTYPGDQLRLEVAVVRRRGPLWRFRGHASVDGRTVAEGEILAMEVRQEK